MDERRDRMNDLEVREEKHLSVEEFYEVNGIPEKEREEFEFIAGALAISALRTMKEAFKIGGYAWHANKRFEQLIKGWSFEKTVAWLNSIGISFGRSSILRFVNVYSTYVCDRQESTLSLHDSYKLVNQQADETVGMPVKTKIIERIFTALPSDDSTNPKELIRELIRAGKVDIEEFTPELATKFRREAEEVANKIKEEAEAERKRIEEEKARLNDTIKQLSRQIAEIKKEAKDEISKEFADELKRLEKERIKFQKEVERLEEKIDDAEEEEMRMATLAEQKEKQLEEIQKKYEEILKEKELIDQKDKELKEFKIRSNHFEDAFKTAQKELKEMKSGEALQRKISAGFSSLDVGIANLNVLKGAASNMPTNLCKFFRDGIQERIERLNFISNTLLEATIIDVKEDIE
jgi:myosin heavy subunit